MTHYLYSELSGLIEARLNRIAVRDGIASGDRESAADWANTHEDTIERLVRDFMPSGSGFDSGTKIDLDKSHADKLVFTTSYHHMNDGGYYSGWTEHTVTVTPSLQHDFSLRVSGRNRNDVKDYMHETFDHALRSDCGYAIWLYIYDMELTPVWTNGSISSWIGKVCTIGTGQSFVDGKPIDAYQTVAEDKSRDVVELAMVDYIKANRAIVRKVAA